MTNQRLSRARRYPYNPHSDVVALTDATGTSVATYAYDVFGAVTTTTESFSNGWHNLYLYDGKDGTRYDGETGLYWMSVRATIRRWAASSPATPSAGHH